MSSEKHKPPRVAWSLVVAALVSLAGCASGPPSENNGSESGASRSGTANDRQESAQDAALPDLPEGNKIEGAREVQRNRTAVVYEWSGTVRPMSGFGVQPPTTTPMEIVAAVPLALRFNFSHESAITDPPETRISIVFVVRDQNDQTRCVARQGQSCEITLTRPVETVRVWELRVDASVTEDVEVPFKVVANIATTLPSSNERTRTLEPPRGRALRPRGNANPKASEVLHSDWNAPAGI